MATNGEASFAIFSYSDINRTSNIIKEGIGIVGFDAGDGRRGDMVVLSSLNKFVLKNANVFRIDGKVYGVNHARILAKFEHNLHLAMRHTTFDIRTSIYS